MDTIDGLPPETRFLMRGLAHGLSLAESAALLALAENATTRCVRAALISSQLPVPSASAGTAALLEAAAPLIEAARSPARRAPATACPQEAVAHRLAHAGLQGPLLLATAEHVADCTPCLERVLELRRGPPPDRDLPSPKRAIAPGSALTLVWLGLVFAAASVALALLFFA